MGYDAACTIRIDGRSARGTAWLEHRDLIFRGPFRVALALSQITEATAEEGTLVVRVGDRRIEFEIGIVAPRWARRITNPPSRLDKLGIKQGMRVALVNLSDELFRDEIQRAGATVLARPVAGTDVVFLGVSTPADLNRVAKLATSVQPNGAVWIVRRKG